MSANDDRKSRRRVYVTNNTEYHVTEGVCVAVRSCSSGDWNTDHEARGRTLAGGILVSPAGGIDVHPEDPEVGDQLCFKPNLMTTAIQRIENPEHTPVPFGVSSVLL